MGTASFLSGQMVFDNNGERAAGALAYFTDAGTTTPKAVYQDGDETTAHENPVEADGNGRWPAIFVPFGSYKLRITTAAGAAIGPTIDDIPNAAPTDPGEGVDADSILTTGDVWFTLKNGTRAGAVRLNGRTIGNAASGGTERANADCADLFAYLWDNLANGQAAVSSGRGATAAADFAANKTITLPDWRGASAIGFDDMGATAASRFTSVPVVSGSGILAGSILGESANLHTLTTAELASHAHTGTTSTESATHTHSGTTSGQSATHTHAGTTGTESATHTHDSTGANPGGTGAAAGAAFIAATTNGEATSTESATHTHSFTTGNASVDHTHTITTGNASATHTHTITTNAEGSGTAHNVLGRVGTGTWLIKL